MSFIQSEANVKPRSFEQHTVNSNLRKANGVNTKSSESLDLHLSAAYDHQNDLFADKAEVVLQLQKYGSLRKKGKKQPSTVKEYNNVILTFGKTRNDSESQCISFQHFFKLQAVIRTRYLHTAWSQFAVDIIHQWRIQDTRDSPLMEIFSTIDYYVRCFFYLIFLFLWIFSNNSSDNIWY